jgi:hypothetical protein
VIYLKSVLTGLAVAIASFLVYGILGVAVALGLGWSPPGVHVSPVSPAGGGGLSTISIEGTPPLVVALILGAFAARRSYRRRETARSRA